MTATSAARSSVVPATVPDPLHPGVVPFGRIPVQNVRPLVDAGARPAKSVEREEFLVTAEVFREGHDAVNATTVLTDPDGVEHHYPMTCDNPGLSQWSALVAADRPGWWTYRVEGWSDPYATWVHDATIKVEAGIDTEMMLEAGARVLERALAAAAADDGRADTGEIRDSVTALRDPSRPAVARLHAATSPEMLAVFAAHPLRELVSPSPAYNLLVERELAL